MQGLPAGQQSFPLAPEGKSGWITGKDMEEPHDCWEPLLSFAVGRTAGWSWPEDQGSSAVTREGWGVAAGPRSWTRACGGTDHRIGESRTAKGTQNPGLKSMRPLTCTQPHREEAEQRLCP